MGLRISTHSDPHHPHSVFKSPGSSSSTAGFTWLHLGGRVDNRWSETLGVHSFERINENCTDRASIHKCSIMNFARRGVVNQLSKSNFLHQVPEFSNRHQQHRTTTVLAVRKENSVAVIGDGQVTLGTTVVKPNARKVRRLGSDKKVIAGFAGATADALTLIDRLESKVDEHPDQLLRACVNLAKDWRMDKYLRRLDATLLVCDARISLYVTGNGDVLESPDGVISIGSGSSYAIAAARALLDVDSITAEQIAEKALHIAADLDIYTNHGFIKETISLEPVSEEKGAAAQ